MPHRFPADHGSPWPSFPDWGSLGGIWRYDNQPIEVDTDRGDSADAGFRDEIDRVARAVGKTGGDVPSRCLSLPAARAGADHESARATNFYVVFSPGRVTILPEYPGVRRIYTDGRKHPTGQCPESFPSWAIPIGHWEDDTLVVDTVGLRPEVQMFYGMPSGGGMAYGGADAQDWAGEIARSIPP